jgi:hypothetical protein
MVQATVAMIINYDHTTFALQAAEVLVPGKPFHPCIIFASKILALPTNIRPAWNQPVVQMCYDHNL